MNIFDTLVKQALYGYLVWEQPYNGSIWPEMHVTTKGQMYLTLLSNRFNTFVKQAFMWLHNISNSNIMAQYGLEMHFTTKSQAYLMLPSNTFDTLVNQALCGHLVWAAAT